MEVSNKGTKPKLKTENRQLKATTVDRPSTVADKRKRKVRK